MAPVAFSGFYTSMPFWAGSAVDFRVPRVDGWFHDQMAAEVYSKETDKFALKVCRDGRILIRITSLERDEVPEEHPPIEETVQRWGEYLGFLNTFYLLLDSATFEIDRRAHFNLHEITTRDVFRVKYMNGKELGGNVPLESITRVYQLGRYVGSYPSEEMIEFDPSIVARAVVSIEAISHAASVFESILASPGAEKDIASLAKSLSEYKVGNYDTAVILAWFITESAINTLWEDQVEKLNQVLPDGSKRINRQRKEFLTNREFSVSVVSNMLELFGVLDHALFLDIDSTRHCRNNIVHGHDYNATAGDAHRAMGVGLSMIERLWNVNLILNFGYSVHGI